jgi:hypothetical protein
LDFFHPGIGAGRLPTAGAKNKFSGVKAMASKRYLEILETVKKNNPEFYKKLMEDEKATKAEASRAQTPKAKSNPLDGVTPEMIKAVRALNESGSGKPDSDYLALLKQYKTENPTATAQECVRAVNKAVPMAREKFIDGQIKAVAAQPNPGAYSGTVDPMSFKQLVKKYRRDFNCSTREAWQRIEEDHPGLRAAYIKKINQ